MSKQYIFKKMHRDDVKTIQEIVTDSSKDLENVQDNLVELFLERTLMLEALIRDLYRELNARGVTAVDTNASFAVAEAFAKKKLPEKKEEFSKYSTFVEMMISSGLAGDGKDRE